MAALVRCEDCSLPASSFLLAPSIKTPLCQQHLLKDTLPEVRIVPISLWAVVSSPEELDKRLSRALELVSRISSQTERSYLDCLYRVISFIDDSSTQGYEDGPPLLKDGEVSPVEALSAIYSFYTELQKDLATLEETCKRHLSNPRDEITDPKLVLALDCAELYHYTPVFLDHYQTVQLDILRHSVKLNFLPTQSYVQHCLEFCRDINSVLQKMNVIKAIQRSPEGDTDTLLDTCVDVIETLRHMPLILPFLDVDSGDHLDLRVEIEILVHEIKNNTMTKGRPGDANRIYRSMQLYLEAMLLAGQMNFQGTIEKLKQALDTIPRCLLSTFYANSIGNFLQGSGQFQEGKAMFEQSLKALNGTEKPILLQIDLRTDTESDDYVKDTAQLWQVSYTRGYCKFFTRNCLATCYLQDNMEREALGLLERLQKKLKSHKFCKTTFSYTIDEQMILTSLAIAQAKCGQMERAEETMQSALKLQDTSLSEELHKVSDFFSGERTELVARSSMYVSANSLTVMFSYNVFAKVYFDANNYPKAEEYMLKSLLIAEKIEGVLNIHSLLLKNSLGILYCEWRKFRESEKYLLDGLAQVEQSGLRYWKGIFHFHLGFLYLHWNKQLVKAESFMIKALSEMPDDQLEHFQAKKALGVILLEEGRCQEAENVLTNCLEMFQSASRENLQCADCLVQLSKAYLRLGRQDEASIALSKAKDYFQPSADHPDLSANFYLAMGQLVLDQGRSWDEALDYFNKARSLYSKSKHIMVNFATMCLSLGCVLELKKSPECVELFHKALEDGKEDGDLAVECYTALGFHYFNTQRYQTALSYLKEGIQFATDLNLSNKSTAYLMALTGKVYCSTGDVQSARMCFAEGFQLACGCSFDISLYPLFFRLGSYFRGLDDQQSEKCLKKALTLVINDVNRHLRQEEEKQVYSELSQLYFTSGKSRLAEYCERKVIELCM